MSKAIETDDPHIICYPNALAPEVCRAIIDRFDGDDRKVVGAMVSGVNPEQKDSTDLAISVYAARGDEEWAKLDGKINEAVGATFQRYMFAHTQLHALGEMIDSGYLVMRYGEGGRYRQHIDAPVPGVTRFAACIIYLNTLEEGMGGETVWTLKRKETMQKVSIRPQEGMIVWAPAGWDWPHEGRPVKEGFKVIISSFMQLPAPSHDHDHDHDHEEAVPADPFADDRFKGW